MPSNAPLVEGWRRLGIRSELLSPPEACRRLKRGDVAIVRLDVTGSLDGVEAGLDQLATLEARGVRVLNRPAALLIAHDKWQTALRLADAGIPHPRTQHTTSIDEVLSLEPPFVLKPQFGSWGQDVMLCRDPGEVRRCLATIRERGWFRRHGVLIQDLVPPLGYDLRVVIAGGRVVGAGRREAAAGEWRTNVSLGGRFISAAPPRDAAALAIDAARVIGADLVGVDLLPCPGSGYAVIEVNGAADFDEDEESLAGRSVHADIAQALGLVRLRRSRPGPHAGLARGTVSSPRVQAT